MSEAVYQDPYPTLADDTQYRLLTRDGVERRAGPHRGGSEFHVDRRRRDGE